MAVYPIQVRICRTLAASRRELESHVAGGVALNVLLSAPRRSQDLDLFHDTEQALSRTVASDQKALVGAGLSVRFLRQAPSFAEAVVGGGSEETLVQWSRDSAFRFFPLVEHPLLGLALHPFDLATNKVLAMAGRLEARDWVDLISSVKALQPLGYLIWAACGKDPGYNPTSLLQQVRRSSHYSQAELDLLDFAGETPSARELGEAWKHMLTEAGKTIAVLPPAAMGQLVLLGDLELCRLGDEELKSALEETRICFHAGALGGAWPEVRLPPG